MQKRGRGRKKRERKEIKKGARRGGKREITRRGGAYLEIHLQ
jgi:hypothetical protein